MNDPIIALTFDDGPNVTITPLVLDLLEKHDVTGTFFLIGKNMTPETEPVIRRALSMGYEIANHSYTHSYMDSMQTVEIMKEIALTEDRIRSVTGHGAAFFRPPYLAVSDEMYESIDHCFIAGLGCEDWEIEVTAKERIRRTLEQACDGAIILLHDMEDNYPTVEALDEVIVSLKGQGYHFATLSQLFKAKHIDPGDHAITRNKIYSVVR